MNKCSDADCRYPACQCWNKKSGWIKVDESFRPTANDFPVWVTIEDKNGMRRVELAFYDDDAGGMCTTNNIWGEDTKESIEYMGGKITHYQPVNQPLYPAEK